MQTFGLTKMQLLKIIHFLTVCVLSSAFATDVLRRWIFLRQVSFDLCSQIFIVLIRGREAENTPSPSVMYSVWHHFRALSE